MLMVRKIVLSIVALLAVGFAAYAQTRQVSGTVKDEAGNAIVGASVIVDGTVNGTTTDANGGFSISAPANATLTVSFIGYEDQTVNIAGKTQLAIVMKENAESIDDVVVMGYGSRLSVRWSRSRPRSSRIVRATTSWMPCRAKWRVCRSYRATASPTPLRPSVCTAWDR